MAAGGCAAAQQRGGAAAAAAAHLHQRDRAPVPLVDVHLLHGAVCGEDLQGAGGGGRGAAASSRAGACARPCPAASGSKGQHSTARNSTAQHSTAQHSTRRRSEPGGEPKRAAARPPGPRSGATPLPRPPKVSKAGRPHTQAPHRVDAVYLDGIRLLVKRDRQHIGGPVRAPRGHQALHHPPVRLPPGQRRVQEVAAGRAHSEAGGARRGGRAISQPASKSAASKRSQKATSGLEMEGSRPARGQQVEKTAGGAAQGSKPARGEAG